jgi:hypothetical protein
MLRFWFLVPHATVNPAPVAVILYSHDCKDPAAGQQRMKVTPRRIPTIFSSDKYSQDGKEKTSYCRLSCSVVQVGCVNIGFVPLSRVQVKYRNDSRRDDVSLTKSYGRAQCYKNRSQIWISATYLLLFLYSRSSRPLDMK